MATDGASCEPDLSRGPDDPAGATAEAAKKEFDVDNLSKSELRMLLSVMEGELEARDLVIEALRARRKEVFIQERYGRFNLNDPFLALQRDYEAGAGDKEKPVCTNPLSILEAVMAHCRKMQERMSTQLAAAESRQKKKQKHLAKKERSRGEQSAHFSCGLQKPSASPSDNHQGLRRVSKLPTNRPGKSQCIATDVTETHLYFLERIHFNYVLHMANELDNNK